MNPADLNVRRILRRAVRPGGGPGSWPVSFRRASVYVSVYMYRTSVYLYNIKVIERNKNVYVLFDSTFPRLYGDGNRDMFRRLLIVLR